MHEMGSNRDFCAATVPIDIRMKQRIENPVPPPLSDGRGPGPALTGDISLRRSAAHGANNSDGNGND
jgi:hypothetical protein